MSGRRRWTPFRWFLLRGTGMPLSWLEPLATLPAGDGPVDEATWRAAADRTRRALAALFRRPVVRHAVFLSNPHLDGHLDRWLDDLESGRRNAKSRARERTLGSYATRFCAKNETASFYGAACLGRFDRVEPIDEAPLPLAGARRVFLEQWMAEALLAAAAADLAAPEGWAQLPQGTRDVVAAAAAKLADLPAGEGRARWQARVAWIDQALARFAAADLPRRRALLAELEAELSAWSGTPARRHPGGWYASRSSLHDKVDRAGRTIGAPEGWRDAIAGALGPWLDLSAGHWLVERATFRAWAAATWGKDTGWRPWSEITAAHDRAGSRYHLAMPAEARALKAQLTAVRDAARGEVDAHLGRHGGGAPLRLDAEALVHAHAPGLAEALTRDGAAFCSPDIMVARGAGGATRIVLGEAHEHVLLEPWLCAAAPELDALLDAQRARLAALAAPDHHALVCRRRQAFTAWGADLGEVALELDARAQAPPERRYPHDALEARLVDGAWRFRVGGRPVVPLSFGRRTRLAARVWPVTLTQADRWLSGPGWRSRYALPRLAWGDLTVHRRRWRLPSQVWATPQLPAWQARTRALAHLGPGLPRLCFSREPGHRKPLVVDWGDPCAIEALLRLARRHEALDLIETVPEPDALWLRGPDGLHTSELRTLFSRR